MMDHETRQRDSSDASCSDPRHLNKTNQMPRTDKQFWFTRCLKNSDQTSRADTYNAKFVCDCKWGLVIESRIKLFDETSHYVIKASPRVSPYASSLSQSVSSTKRNWLKEKAFWVASSPLSKRPKAYIKTPHLSSRWLHNRLLKCLAESSTTRRLIHVFKMSRHDSKFQVTCFACFVHWIPQE